MAWSRPGSPGGQYRGRAVVEGQRHAPAFVAVPFDSMNNTAAQRSVGGQNASGGTPPRPRTPMDYAALAGAFGRRRGGCHGSVMVAVMGKRDGFVTACGLCWQGLMASVMGVMGKRPVPPHVRVRVRPRGTLNRFSTMTPMTLGSKWRRGNRLGCHKSVMTASCFDLSTHDSEQHWEKAGISSWA